MLSEKNPEKKFIDMDEKENMMMTTKTITYFLQKDLIPLDPAPTKLYLNYKGFNMIKPEALLEVSP